MPLIIGIVASKVILNFCLSTTSRILQCPQVCPEIVLTVDQLLYAKAIGVWLFLVHWIALNGHLVFEDHVRDFRSPKMCCCGKSVINARHCFPRPAYPLSHSPLEEFISCSDDLYLFTSSQVPERLLWYVIKAYCSTGWLSKCDVGHPQHKMVAKIEFWKKYSG